MRTMLRIANKSVFPMTLLACALIGFASPSVAQGIERIGDYGGWSAYQFVENGQTTCYMASAPSKDEGDYTNRGKIYARVTHRPAENTKDEVSLLAGYTYLDKSFATATIGNKTFDLFTDKDTAWAPDATTDSQLVRAMKAGQNMVVRGTSSRGTDTKDTYSLIGFTKAYNAISKACAK